MFGILHHLFSSQNQFASGGLLLMAIGSLGVFLRALPGHAWAALLRQTTMTITVKDDDAAFGWVKEWFLEQPFLGRVRRVDLDTTLRGAEIALLPAPGTHLFWHKGRPFLVSIHRSEDTKGRKERRTETLTFHTVGRKRSFLQNLVNEIAACHRSRANATSSLYVYDDYWTTVQAYAPRLLSSVILAGCEKERIVLDLGRFRASRERYRQLGVPYHRGYLLHGPPGTGKSSLVSALAAHFGLSLYAINLTELNDRSLKIAMNDVPEDSVILFEDIDCMRAGNRRTEGKSQPDKEGGEDGVDRFGVTLSGLLNVLDGFHAPENVVFVMTTNDAAALDPALLRPGRIDYRLFLGGASERQKSELYRRFFPDEGETNARKFVAKHAATTMAEFQGLLLRRDEQGTGLGIDPGNDTVQDEREVVVC